MCVLSVELIDGGFGVWVCVVVVVGRVARGFGFGDGFVLGMLNAVLGLKGGRVSPIEDDGCVICQLGKRGAATGVAFGGEGSDGGAGNDGFEVELVGEHCVCPFGWGLGLGLLWKKGKDNEHDDAEGNDGVEDGVCCVDGHG